MFAFLFYAHGRGFFLARWSEINGKKRRQRNEAQFLMSHAFRSSVVERSGCLYEERGLGLSPRCQTNVNGIVVKVTGRVGG